MHGQKGVLLENPKCSPNCFYTITLLFFPITFPMLEADIAQHSVIQPVACVCVPLTSCEVFAELAQKMNGQYGS